ncbi:hypothetical protein OJF2_72980 [Aquisphaera giovannonii]|uniref:Zinc-finger domain-containing protein n=1 Tax=Aquisphaera giovannonii TaxID=406548 RepID=A0A5B9WDP1_9BACT|nr:hypothetical protein [Aquisphaera giovannonii]QEH38692.1 hypothetical protein OJF2_72980 [Aquisphaera giovannonii]
MSRSYEQGHDHHRDRESPSPAIDDASLRDYLADVLAPGEMARVEKALRDSAELRARLEEVRNNREDVQLHTLGAIWHRSRLTCPSRQQLGSLLLDALDPDLAGYFRFHIDVVECPYCQANLADLESQTQGPSGPQASRTRQHKILKVSKHLLNENENR